MRAQISAVILSACAVLACASTERPNTTAAQPVEERAQPIQEAARAQPLAAAPPEQPSPPPSASVLNEQVKVGSALLTLEGCQLTIESSGTIQKYALPMPDGCTFGKRKAGGPVQIETTKRGLTVLVVSSKVVGPHDCDTHVRAIVVDKKDVAVSTDEQNIGMCGADGPFETPMFVVLAASAKPLN
jgi:hypothetical protein